MPEQVNLKGIFGVTITAEDMIADGRYYCRKKASYFESLLYLCSVVFTEKVQTMAVSKHLVVYVNRKWVESKTIEEIGGVWAHELMHPLLDHAARIEENGYDPKVGNVAGDLAINDALLTGGWALPSDGCFPKTYGFPGALSLDDYYALLVKKFGGVDQAKEALEGKGKGEGKDGQASNKNGQNTPGQGQGQGKGQPSSQKGQGAGSGPGGFPGQTQGGGQGGNSGEEPQRGHAGAGDCGGCSGNPIEGLEEDQNSPLAKSQDTIDSVRMAVAEAINEHIAQRGVGSVPALLGRWAELQKKPALVPWQRLLARAIRRASDMRRGDLDYTYSRPSRKQSAIDDSLEALGCAGSAVRPSMWSPIPRVDIGIDTSGSMGSEELSQCAAEIDGILRVLGDTEVGVWACDCRMQAHAKVKKAAEAVKLFKGGGGTDFRPFFEHMLAQRKNRPGVIVILTDGCGPAPETQPAGVDVIWVLVGPYRTQPTDWGQHIFVGGERDE